MTATSCLTPFDATDLLVKTQVEIGTITVRRIMTQGIIWVKPHDVGRNTFTLLQGVAGSDLPRQ
jgi:hypothetical protein